MGHITFFFLSRSPFPCRCVPSSATAHLGEKHTGHDGRLRPQAGGQLLFRIAVQPHAVVGKAQHG